MKTLFLQLSIIALALALPRNGLAQKEAAKRSTVDVERAYVESALDPQERERAEENARRAMGDETLREKAAREARERIGADVRRIHDEEERDSRLKNSEAHGSVAARPLLKPLKLKPLEPAAVCAVRNQLSTAPARLLKHEEANIALRSVEPYDIVATFRGRKVWEVTTTHDVELFRVHSDVNDPASPWFLCCEQGSGQNRHLDAVGRALPPWNKQAVLTSVTIPKDTTVYIGFSSDQVYTPRGMQPVKTIGGAVQIFMKRGTPDSTNVTSGIGLIKHQYRRRAPGEATPEQKSSAGTPRGPIKVKLDLSSAPLKPSDPLILKGEPPTTTGSATLPSGEEFWFDQISLMRELRQRNGLVANRLVISPRRSTAKPSRCASGLTT